MPEHAPAVTPISLAWVSTGGTGAPNYDEFNSYDEVTALIEANPPLPANLQGRIRQTSLLGASATITLDEVEDAFAAMPAGPESFAAAGREAEMDVIGPPLAVSDPRP